MLFCDSAPKSSGMLGFLAYREKKNFVVGLGWGWWLVGKGEPE